MSDFSKSQYWDTKESQIKSEAFEDWFRDIKGRDPDLYDYLDSIARDAFYAGFAAGKFNQ
jgi:hypothetical protein